MRLSAKCLSALYVVLLFAISYSCGSGTGNTAPEKKQNSSHNNNTPDIIPYKKVDSPGSSKEKRDIGGLCAVAVLNLIISACVLLILRHKYGESISKLQERVKDLEKRNDQGQPSMKVKNIENPNKNPISSVPKHDKPEDTAVSDVNKQTAYGYRVGDTMEMEVNNSSTAKSIYFGIPEEDGSFNANKAINNNAGERVFYRVDLNADAVTGTITFLEDMSSPAISQRDFILYAVCETENPEKWSHTHSVSIKVTSPGVVRLAGDKWQVETKIKIRLC